MDEQTMHYVEDGVADLSFDNNAKRLKELIDGMAFTENVIRLRVVILMARKENVAPLQELLAESQSMKRGVEKQLASLEKLAKQMDSKDLDTVTNKQPDSGSDEQATLPHRLELLKVFQSEMIKNTANLAAFTSRNKGLLDQLFKDMEEELKQRVSPSSNAPS